MAGMNQPPRDMRRPLRLRLEEPVDGASIAVFRAAFGLTMLVEVLRFFAHGWIARYYIHPGFHFTYYGFGWIRPWPAPAMYAHFVLLGAAAAGVAVGYRYRVSAAALSILFTYVFLLEAARYLNHLYAAALFALLLAVIPASNALSVDSWRRHGACWAPVPRWSLWLLRFQVGVIYFFGGLAKLNADWVRGEPMRTWLLERADAPLIGFIVRNHAELLVFSYGGLAFDLLVVPALLWRRTRAIAFVVAVIFHVVNSQLFSIGIFPWMMIAATTLFFEPAWPRRVMSRLGAGARVAGESVPDRTRFIPGIAVLYVAIQLLVPLRHLVYPGNVSWTEEGHRFAWHMKLRDKDGSARFFVTDRASGITEEVLPGDELMPWQVEKMVTRPDMILQYAQHLAARRGGADHVSVRVRAVVSLNGAEPRLMIDPTADLASELQSVRPAGWIIVADSGNSGVGNR
jgi:hypothetical protein